MSKLHFYADDTSQKVLSEDSQKIISIGGDFGYGNFGDVLQHINALRAIKKAGRFATVSVMAANAISSQIFPSFVSSAYKTDAVIFVSSHPLILADTDPQLSLVGKIRNVAGLCLYGGGFLNSMWGDFVLSVVEHFLRLDQRINYWVSGQQITTPFEGRVLEHIKAFHPKLFGVRDELSLRLLADLGYDAEFSFDDATEALADFSQRLGVRQGQGLALHLNLSDYTANTSLAHGVGRELAKIALHDAANHKVTVFQAFRDAREEVIDTSESIKRLEHLYPFHSHRTIDLVGLLFDDSEFTLPADLDFALGYSCSYHVALWLQLAGVPCWLRSSNPFYDQKSRALQVVQGLDEFLRSPRLADHSFNLERRAAWNDKLQRYLSSIDPVENCLSFENIEDGPAPWYFFYKGRPTLQEKLSSAEKNNQWFRSRAEVAERELGAARSENAELSGRVEALSAQLTEVGNEAHRQRERAEAAERELGAARSENAELSGRVEALSAQLTEVGDEADRQRERAEAAERELVAARSENAELSGRVEALSAQLTEVGNEAHRQRERAEVAERELVAARSENAELSGRVEALSAQLTEVGNEAHRQRERAEVAERELVAARSENAELSGRVEALSAQLTEVGNEAHRQRERAEVAERELVAARSENAELSGRVEALSTQISVILASRSWRLTRGLRVIGRVFRGEFGAVFAALRQRFTRHRS